LAVVHDQIAVSKAARRAEIQNLSIYGALEGNGRIAQRTKGHDQWLSTDRIVGDLMPDQDLDGICLRVLPDLNQDDGFSGFQPGIGL
jgi:hypothetical protein